MSIPRAQVEITASSSKLAAAFAAAKSTVVGFGKFAIKQLGSLKMGDTASRAAGNMLGNLGTRGLDSVFDQASQVRDFERGLVRFGIAASSTPDQINIMRNSIRQLSQDTAIGSADILAASQTYLDLTGDVAGTAAATRSFARIAQASGSSMSDVANAAAALGDSLQIKPEQIEGVFSGLIAQGKAGAVSLKDFSAEITALAPKFANFSKSMGPEGAAQLGAAFQVAKKGFGSASEAATGLQALMGALTINAAKFKGVQVFEKGTDGVKRMRNMHDIINQISNSRLAKDPTLLAKAFGSKEALAAFDQLRKNKGMYDQMIEAGKDTQAVNRDIATFLESDAGRLDKSFNKMKETIAEAFTPERIKAFTDGIENLSKRIGPLVDGLGRMADIVGGGATSMADFLAGPDELQRTKFEDQMIVSNNGMFARQGENGMDLFRLNPSQLQARVSAAKSRLADQDALVATKKSLGGDGSFTKSSIEQAMTIRDTEGKYAIGQGRVGEIVAAKEYIAAAKKTTEGRAALDEIAASIKQQTGTFEKMMSSMLGVTVKVGADTVAKAQANAPVHSARPGGRGG